MPADPIREVEFWTEQEAAQVRWTIRVDGRIPEGGTGYTTTHDKAMWAGMQVLRTHRSEAESALETRGEKSA